MQIVTLRSEERSRVTRGHPTSCPFLAGSSTRLFVQVEGPLDGLGRGSTRGSIRRVVSAFLTRLTPLSKPKRPSQKGENTPNGIRNALLNDDSAAARVHRRVHRNDIARTIKHVRVVDLAPIGQRRVSVGPRCSCGECPSHEAAVGR